MIRRKHAAIWGAAALLVAGLPMLAATAEPGENGSDDGDTRSESLYGLREDLPAAAQHVSADMASRATIAATADEIAELGEGAGFAGQVIDQASSTITVYWKGAAPKTVHTLAAQRTGPTVKIVEGRPYSRAEVMAASERLMQSAVADQIGVQSTAVRPDGTGLEVRVQGQVPAEQGKAEVARVAGIDASGIGYVENSGGIELLAARYNDSPAWKGGGRTRQGSFACSTGFAALSGAQGRLLSANHCDPSANAVVTDGAGEIIAPGGASVSGYPSIDSQSLDPSASPATIGQIFIGGWNSGTVAAVKNWASNWNGQWVCSGGATTGTHCGSITDDATQVNGLPNSWFVEASHPSTLMAGGADSGGPIYANIAGGVQARGTLIGGIIGTEAACGAHNPDVNPTCYRTIIYVPISVVLNSWGLGLEMS